MTQGGAYVPQLRRTPVQILMPTGWIAGTLHIPANRRLVEHLNHTRDFLALTGVRFESKPEPIEFFAVRREAVILMLASPQEHSQNVVLEEQTIHHLSCLLERGTLYGRFKTLKGVRVSDYISSARGFFLLEDCDMVLSDRWGRTVREEHRTHVLVNVHHVIGVAESRYPSGS